MLAERCPKCAGVIEYREEAQALRCPHCGHVFMVVEFVSERLRMEQALMQSEAAREQLRQTEQEKQSLQNRLNQTLCALQAIEASQTGEEAQLREVMGRLTNHEQTYAAMTDFLLVLRHEQSAGQDAVFDLLKTVMHAQSGAEDKLSAVLGLAGKILHAQQADAQEQEQLRRDVTMRLMSMQLDMDRVLSLSAAFGEWSRCAREEDVERLDKICVSADRLLQQQQQARQQAIRLESAISSIQSSIDAFRDEVRQQQLDVLVRLYQQANDYMCDRDFQKAENAYRQVLIQGGESAEVYWRLLLCHYCVEYQEDENRRIIPIILNPDLTDPDSMSVRKNLQKHIRTSQQREYYETRLAQIDRYLNGYRQLHLHPEWQFDVFISVKQSFEGHPTTDSFQASELYHYLTGKGLRVFNSRCTPLPAGQEYEPYIISSLMSAKVLIVVGSRPEFMNAQWVRNEWSRFQWLQRSDEARTGKTDRTLFCYLTGGMTPEQIPAALNPNRQAIIDGFAARGQLKATLKPIFPHIYESKPAPPPPAPPQAPEIPVAVQTPVTPEIPVTPKEPEVPKTPEIPKAPEVPKTPKKEEERRNGGKKLLVVLAVLAALTAAVVLVWSASRTEGEPPKVSFEESMAHMNAILSDSGDAYLPADQAIPYEITLEGDTYTLPCPVSSLMANGWQLYEYTSDTGAHYYEADELIPPGDIRVDAFIGTPGEYDSDGTYRSRPEDGAIEATVTVSNVYPEPRALKDCTIIEISTSIGAASMSWNGISLGSDYSSAKSILRELREKQDLSDDFYHSEFAPSDEDDLFLGAVLENYIVSIDSSQSDRVTSLSVGHQYIPKDAYESAIAIASTSQQRWDDYAPPSELGNDLLSRNFSIQEKVFRGRGPLYDLIEQFGAHVAEVTWHTTFATAAYRGYGIAGAYEGLIGNKVYPYSLAELRMKVGNDIFYVLVENETDQILSPHTCTIRSIRDAESITLPGGIQIGTSYETLVQLLEEQGIDYDEHTDSSDQVSRISVVELYRNGSLNGGVWDFMIEDGEISHISIFFI